MTLRLHNTPTRTTEPFVSQYEQKVSLYTCGPTVYNYLHVGNWAAYIYWDILVRTLIAHDYDVVRVMNITDVGHLTSDADEGEDKLEKGARREGKTAWEVATFYTDDFLEGMKQLNLIAPTHVTKATEHIDIQLDLIRILKEKGYTYQIDDGIYFDTAKFPHYAEFARLDLAAQKAGARVELNQEKRNPSDFALWKFSPAHEQRDMEWETPLELLENATTSRPGFPGWHLECSAMAMHYLGTTLDIHTGGIDHIPVHHTNEIAQSESATDKQFSRFWLHNNHLTADGTKISKSLGNGYTLSDLAARGFTAMDYRVFVLQSHYRSESNFTFESLTAAKQRLLHWRSYAALRHQIHDTIEDDANKQVSFYAAANAILEKLNDDLNTPEALALVDATFAQTDGVALDKLNRHSYVDFLTKIDEFLGLNLLETTPDIDEHQKQLLLERQRVREAKDWTRADEIRDELLSQGIAVRDTTSTPIWYYV